ncbi:MAG: transcriptional regulator [Mycobacterium sp.]|jgi:TetR/AcrR family transcriptional repressor of uid operon|nr:transcriptional regulator [Mycobacterium sp.]
MSSTNVIDSCQRTDYKGHTMARVADKQQGREAQRLLTRRRVLDAAIAEFKRSGMAEADIGAIVAAAGVARGTFYFHFPTKEHVLLELQQHEEARVATELSRFLDGPHDLASALSEVVRLVVAAERRLGGRLFRDVVALNFLPTRPPDDDQADHPVVAVVAAEIRRARQRGEAGRDVDAYHSAVFFLLGLYALLSTTNSRAVRAGMLEKFVVSVRRSMQAR